MRGLAHPGHWKGPLGPIFEAFGAVKASPMSAYKLLKEGEAVLLFPGGGREVCQSTICYDMIASPPFAAFISSCMDQAAFEAFSVTLPSKAVYYSICSLTLVPSCLVRHFFRYSDIQQTDS